jgi:oxygen-independent coproporphyrinogen-3 oxidase
VELFATRCGLPLSAAEAGLRAAEDRGLIERGPRRIRPSSKGRRFLNDLFELFLPAQVQ